jgi:hypothetical protein
MAVWPPQLPIKPLAGSYKKTVLPNAVTFQPDVGAPIQRRRYEGWTTQETWRNILTAEQVVILDEFYFVTLQHGVLSFIGHLVDGRPREWWFEPETPPDYDDIPGDDGRYVTLSMRSAS